MNTLFDLYSEKLNNTEFWSYYSSGIRNLNGEEFCNNIFTDKEKSFEFIKCYFSRGNKEELLTFNESSDVLEFINKRSIHTVSTFFIGLIIAEHLQINTLTHNEENMDFKYYWFLTCLYHDIGYMYEKNTCENLSNVSTDGFLGLKSICGIKYLHCRIFKTYRKSTIESYLRYRAKCKKGKQGSIDHGITGGLMLYDRLIKQFYISWKKRTNPSHSKKDFYVISQCGNRLHVSNEHFEDYAKIANAIIRHNIWKETFEKMMDTCAEVDKVNYVDVKLSSKIEDKLCFLLSMADTIEPAKRYEKYLKEVKLSLCCNEINILVSIDDYCAVYREIKDLEKWVNISVETTNCDINKMHVTLKILR